MPASTTRVRLSKPGKAVAAKAGATRRKARSPRKAGEVAKLAVAATIEGDARLVALFAEALGQRVPRPSRGKRRTLAQALRDGQACNNGSDCIDAMTGARLAQAPHRDSGDNTAPRLAPCAQVHRRNRLRRVLAGAGGWSLAIAVTAAIAGTAAAGLLAYAPQDRQTIAAASAAQF
jgi:hypothetical protein